MPSALTKRGSTRAWRTIRQTWTDHLAQVLVVDCWRHAHNTAAIADARARGDVALLVPQAPNCTRTIHHGQAWHLGHRTDRHTGGDDTQLGYECVPCSNHTGGRIGATITNTIRRHTTNRRPSRRW